MTALQVIFAVGIVALLAVIVAFQIVKMVYAIKSKGETLRPKGDSESNKEKGGREE